MFEFTVMLILILIPILVGKCLQELDNRRWKRKLRGVTDRYIDETDRKNGSFHEKHQS